MLNNDAFTYRGRQDKTDENQKRAFAEIFWGLLNSPEFVLEK